MPRIRTSRTKPPPEGFEEIEDILEDYQRQMRDAESADHEGKRKTESLWPIMRISHTRSRYIYDLYYKREAISRELYDWLLKEQYADAKSVRVTGRQKRRRRTDGIFLLLLLPRIPQSHCEMEAKWVRKVVLRALHPVARHEQFRIDVHLSRAKERA